MRKRTFLLLEVLIAVSLIALCAVPLIVRPMQLYRKETAYLWEMQQEQLADWSFSEIKEKLLANTIPWKKLPTKKGEKSPSFSLPDAQISIPGGQSKIIHREFVLKCRKDDVTPKGDLYLLLEARITFSPHFIKKKSLKYKVVVRKLLEQKEKEEA